MTDSKLTILGRGRVGGSLAAAAERSGIEITEGAGAVLICVPDDSIGEVCRELGDRTPALVGHTSGACGLDVLSAAAERGASTFTLHPLQTFPGPDTAISGTPCAISGDGPAAIDYAEHLAAELGMRPFRIPDEARAEYHAAASMASNFLIAIEEAATELLARAGIEDGRDLLSPLVLRTAANWSEGGASALTGPIARGDEETVRRHREAIGRTWPELLDAYDRLAEITETIARSGEAAGK